MEGGQEGGKEHGGGARKSGRGKAFTARQLESNFMPAEGGMEGGQEGGKGHGGGANKGGRRGMEGRREGRNMAVAPKRVAAARPSAFRS